MTLQVSQLNDNELRQLMVKVQQEGWSIHHEQNFTSSTNYKSQSQYSDTISLENTSTDILINNIYQKLLIKLSENIIL